MLVMYTMYFVVVTSAVTLSYYYVSNLLTSTCKHTKLSPLLKGQPTVYEAM